MLIEFSVKNFLSFKEKVTLSLEKESGNENEENTFTFNNEELLKTAVIYGANASGKSNLIKAFTIAILMVRNSNMISLGGKWDILTDILVAKNRQAAGFTAPAEGLCLVRVDYGTAKAGKRRWQ